jgi:uncharacterized protein (TIGR00725 family)
MSYGRRPIVGVMGSHLDREADQAASVGRWLAREGVHLLTGGGDGVMDAVSEAFFETSPRAGQVLAVLPCVEEDPRCSPVPGYPNRWVEIPIFTHLGQGGPAGDEPSSRNHINILTSTVVILLPGGAGTASEARLSLRYGRPSVAYLMSRAEIPGLPDGIPLTSDFEEVCAFVRTHSAAWPPHDGSR